jgi:hypothetical protein
MHISLTIPCAATFAATTLPYRMTWTRLDDLLAVKSGENTITRIRI